MIKASTVIRTWLRVCLVQWRTSIFLVTPGNTVEPEFSASLSLYRPHFTARSHVEVHYIETLVRLPNVPPFCEYGTQRQVESSLRLHAGVRSLDNVHK